MQRIKGQELSMIFVVGGQPKASVTDFRNAEFEFMLDRTQEGYLGETSDRFDEILKGMHVTTDLHFENQDILGFIQAVIDRAARRNLNLKINLQATLNFPNGQRPKLYANDLFFGNIPMGFGGRAEYGSVKLDMACSAPRLVLS